MSNPLIEQSSLPPFSVISTDDVVPAIEQLVAEANESLAAQLETLDRLDWNSLVSPIEESQDRISQAWSPVCHINAVCNSDELREAYEKAHEILTNYYTEFGQNDVLFEAYERLQQSSVFETFSPAQKQSVFNSLRDFRLSGVALKGEAKEKYKAIKSKLSSIKTKFSNNVLDASNGWTYHICDESRLDGLPEFLRQGARALAKEKKIEGWVFTLDMPVYFTVLTQSKDAEFRKAMYEAYCTRASDQGPTAGQWDNSELITEILALRQEQACLLGYRNYAEVSLASKMAESPEQVIDFLEDLASKARPFADKELKELETFAKEEFGAENLDAWDIPYYSEQLKLKKYNVSQELLRPYFPVNVVKAGLFQLLEKLYSVEVKSADAEVWHDDASYYELFRDGEKIAGFYLDLYARAKKRGGAWMADCRTRRFKGDQLQLPVAFLTCNFSAPQDGKPALLTHNEVTTLFHEFGHGLHHMLTKMDVASVSGISGVEWDAVELPSQFMENFCWQPEVLNFISSHYETNVALPQDVLDNMLAAKNFQTAMQMLRQLELSIFDLRLHIESGSEGFPGVQALLNDVRSKVSVIQAPDFNRFQNGFTHIFAGGYAAGYYSYKWAEVLSADAFSMFEEEGVLNENTGRRFLENILEKGGSQSALELFTAFRGRAPKADALMRHSGLCR